jgi:hypothetical protein
VRTIGEPDGRGVTDVYWRPARGMPAPPALLAQLSKRLVPATTAQRASA